ncbi:MAG: M10 family metallopeptidase [Pacificimonas sp.]
MAVVRDFTAILSDVSVNNLPGTGIFMTYAFPTTSPDYHRNYLRDSEVNNFARFGATDKLVTRDALDAISSVSGITFLEVDSDDADILFTKFDFRFSNNPNGGFAYFPSGDRSSDIESDIFVNRQTTVDTELILHEVGHAVGLKHPFDGDPTLPLDLDNSQTTVMAYRGATDRLGPFDIDALQFLYGPSGNSGAHLSSWNWDEATETLSQTGTSGDDIIDGVGGRDIIEGGLGDDLIRGGLGDDTLSGGDGADIIQAGRGDDSLFDRIDTDAMAFLDGGRDDDLITVVLGTATPAALIDGGSGRDEVALLLDENFGQPISLGDLSFSRVETISLQGTRGDDDITAGVARTEIRGGRGADIFRYSAAEQSSISASDTLADFESGIDRIDLSFADYDDIRIESADDGARIVVDSATLPDFRLNVTGTVRFSDILASGDRPDDDPNTPPPPSSDDPADGFRLITSAGWDGAIGGTGLVFGSTGTEAVEVAGAAANISFDPSFNRGGDLITLAGAAADYQVARNGSQVVFSSADSNVAIPVGTAGVFIGFESDGVLDLVFDTDSGSVRLGGTTVEAEPTAVPPTTDLDPFIAVDPLAPAILSLGANVDNITTIGGTTTVFGRVGTDTLVIFEGGDIRLDASFNRGGDTIGVGGERQEYDVVRDGSAVILSRGLANDDVELVEIPVGTVGATLAFADQDLTLRFDTDTQTIKLGDDEISSAAPASGAFADERHDHDRGPLFCPCGCHRHGDGHDDTFDGIAQADMPTTAFGTGENAPSLDLVVL